MKIILTAILILIIPVMAVWAQNPKEWPRIMVIMSEKVDTQKVDTRIVASKIEEFFLEKGFRLVDKAQYENVSTRDIEIAEGNPMHAKELGKRFGAELIIVGNAEAQIDAEKEYYGIKNYEYVAKADCKVIIMDTGELIAVLSKNAKKSAGGKNSAANFCLLTLGETLAADLYVKIRIKMKNEIEETRIVQLAIMGVDEKLVSQYENNLPREIPLIAHLILRHFDKESALFEASIYGKLDDLRYEIGKRYDLVVISSTATRLDVCTKEYAEKTRGSVNTILR